MTRERLQDGSGQIWKIAKVIGWVFSLVATAITVVVFVFLTFETKADADREHTSLKTDAVETRKADQSDFREIRRMITELYKLETERGKSK